MSRSKKNWDRLVDFEGNYYEVNRDVGVERVIGNEDIEVNPPTGVDEVTFSIRSTSTLLREGDEISKLDNNAGYLTEVDELNEIGDVNSPAPTAGQVLTWTGTEWTNRDSAAPDSFRYRGKKNVAVDFPEADPREGWTYIQDGQDAATPNAAWVGITTESVDNLDLVVYASNQWTVVKGAFDVISFQDLNADNAAAPQPGEPGGYLSYDPNTATFTLYPADVSLLPDTDNPDEQADTLDERYVLKTGDTMTGDLSLGTNDFTANDATLTGALTLAQILKTGGGDLEVYSGVELGLTVATHTDGNAYVRLENDPVGPKDAVTLGYLESELQELENDTDDTYVKKAGDTLTGGLIFENSGTALNFQQNTTINTEAGKSLNIKSGDNPRLTITENSILVKEKPFRVQALDSEYVLEVRPGADLAESNGKYKGKIDHNDHLVNKKYVNDEDQIVAQSVSDLNDKVDALELGIPEADADAKYLQEIVVQETNTLPSGQDASVSVANKNEFTFGIPTGPVGPKGNKGDKGGKGDRGPTGADGTGADGKDGQKGAQGQKGEPGTKGAPGSNGSKGQKGATGASGSGGSFVTRGNTGSNIRIYYSNNRYYIAGTN